VKTGMCRIRGNSAMKSHKTQVTAIWRSYFEVHESVGYIYSFLCLNWLRSCIATTLKLHCSHDLNSPLKYQSSNLRACLVQLVDWLVYEVVDGTNSFPHFHGPSQSFIPLSLDVVIKAEKLVLEDGQFSCSLLS
jgi:hypothetical protein